MIFISLLFIRAFSHQQSASPWQVKNLPQAGQRLIVPFFAFIG
jgi:hypothetical protein